MEGSLAPSTAEKKMEETPLQRIKKWCVLLGASLEEGFGYAKGAVVGFTKKLTAKSEEDATAADMQAAKMQVAAADHAEDVKKSLY
ncbi:hypothetical protein C2S51_037189 [Perilla frutescens var. frutescens]|nr:hypothetical protein C2S51_037189 [Perilla frutescens var. frutescens]